MSLARDYHDQYGQKTSPNLTDNRLKITSQVALQNSFVLCHDSVMKKIITCIKCNAPLIGKQTKFCSSTCKNNSLQSYQAQQMRGLKRKLSLVKNLGSKCSICGYNKNISALTFHHLDPKKKSFQLDLRSLSNRKQTFIDIEITKCILVCSNCHAELHYPQHNLE